MANKKNQIVDRIGIVTSGICAVHCAFIPLLFSFGIIGGFADSLHTFSEMIIIGVSAFLGVWSIYNGLKEHGQLIPQFLIAFGAFIILFGFITTSVSHIVMAIGGAILLTGHWLNWRGLTIQNID